MKSESEVQQLIQMEAAKYGILLLRNNSGAGKFIDEETGQESYVRFGLGNISKQQNERIKSSDLIGIWNLPTNQGDPSGIGVFIAVEVKKEGWKYTGTPREVAQLAFIDLVKSKGGVAGFASNVDEFLRLIGKL